MRKVSPGLVCIVLGVVLLLAAGGLYAYNRYEDAHAGAEAQTVVADLQHVDVVAARLPNNAGRGVAREEEGPCPHVEFENDRPVVEVGIRRLEWRENRRRKAFVGADDLPFLRRVDGDTLFGDYVE